MSSLLPPNASELERILESVAAEALTQDIPIRDLWNPFKCPAKLLPWLAWAFSVDEWDEDWPESTKRIVIQDSFEIHQFKGTPHSVEKALSGLDINTEIVEWWEPGGSQVPGTVQIDTMMSDATIGLDSLVSIDSAVRSAKRGVIHHTIRTISASDADIAYSAATLSAMMPDIEYYTLSVIDTDGSWFVSAATLSASCVTIGAYDE